MVDRLPRLVYLATRLGPDAVKMPRELKRIVPHFELYETVAKEGINAAAISLEIPRAQLRRLHDRGKQSGPGTMEEFRLLVAQEVMEDDLDGYNLKQQLGIMSNLERWVQRSDDTLVNVDEISLLEIGDDLVIPKFDTGFTPLDLALYGGAYQGILVFMAPPGVGKTSVMLSVMEAVHLTHPTWDNIFFEMEIPKQLMSARISPMVRRSPFKETDRLIVGSLSIEEIEKRLEELPENPDGRVVYIDGPDAMPGLGGERRVELGHIYRRLVHIKETASLVVVSSQPNREGAKRGLSLGSMAESWEKAWYADIVVGLNSIGADRMRLKVFKNRFGQNHGEVQFEYDLETLKWSDPFVEDDGW